MGRLLGISFIALSAGTLEYPDGTGLMVWLPDATISYFSGVHIPLFIAAILIIVVGLVYTAVLFLWQWLLQLPKWQVFAWAVIGCPSNAHLQLWCLSAPLHPLYLLKFVP